MTNTPKEAADDLTRLVELRRTIGTLRRALSPHREVVISLSHPELDALSSEKSAQRFAELERRVTHALDAAREAKESTFGSFDLPRHPNRTTDKRHHEGAHAGHRDPPARNRPRRHHGHELPGRSLRPGLGIWVWIATMLGIAVVVLSVARGRDWI